MTTPAPERGEKPPADPRDAFLAFRRRCFDPRECERSGNGVYGMDGRRPVRLTSDASDRDPVWSPDGRRLAFVRCTPGDCDVWTVHLATGREQRATRGPGVDRDPAWARDGRRIVFSRCRGGDANTCELWVVGRAGSQRRLTRNPVADAHPDWSWSSGEIVFDRGDCGSGTSGCRRSRVVVMRPGGGATKVLGRGWEPQWDPTRRRIVYDACRGYCARVDREQGSPLVVLSLGGKRRVIRTRLESAFSPSFSPDGRRLVIALYSGDDGAVGDLVLRTGRERAYYSDYGYHALTPDWRPGPHGDRPPAS